MLLANGNILISCTFILTLAAYSLWEIWGTEIKYYDAKISLIKTTTFQCQFSLYLLLEDFMLNNSFNLVYLVFACSLSQLAWHVQHCFITIRIIIDLHTQFFKAEVHEVLCIDKDVANQINCWIFLYPECVCSWTINIHS